MKRTFPGNKKRLLNKEIAQGSSELHVMRHTISTCCNDTQKLNQFEV